MIFPSYWILILVVYFFSKTDSANILYLAGIPSPSHGLWNFRLIEALVDKGHNITVLTVDKSKKPIKNVHILDMEETYEMVYGDNDVNLGDFMSIGIFDEIQLLFDFIYKFCKAFATTKSFETLLQYPDNFKFDLVINDLTISSCLVGFLHKFNYPPLINVSPYKFTTSLAERTSSHQYAGYIPRPQHPYTTSMTFMQKFKNHVGTIYEILYRQFVFQSKLDKLIAKMFRRDDIPSCFELDQKAAITLLNTHPATDFPVALPPNVIEVGGLQIAEPKPIPSDITNFIEKSIKGAVLISFGTNVRSDLFEDDQQKILMDVVKKFPDYHFLWKFEMDPSEGKIRNLMVKPWLPQNDILAHPKVKAFISHTGGLSTHEATWHGVPLVAVPFFMDQFANSHAAVLAGVATYVNVQKLRVEEVEAAVRAVLDDSMYAERMKKRSFRFKTRPMKPVETAIWWIEYVLKDPDPVHLKSPVAKIGLFRANSYDLMLVCLGIFVIGYLTILYLFSKIYKPLRNDKIKIN